MDHEKKGGGVVEPLYIDDFITVARAASDECKRNVEIMHESCEETGLPEEPEKNEGPATTIGFLGLELDSETMEIRLPQDKLARTRGMLASWRGRKACRKRELLSLIGVLSHAAKAVRAGRSFLRRMIDLSCSVKHLEQFVRMNKEARADIEWWYQYVETWNGTAMMFAVRGSQPPASVTSDASGNWGCGAYSGSEWFMLQWVGPIQSLHITVKELAPIVVAAILWGRSWGGKVIHVQCDNSAVVSIVNQGSSRNSQAMQLTRCLAFLAAKWEFHIIASHIKGVDNILADALSRDNLPLFRTLYPQASPVPAVIPEAVLDLLFLREPEWTSRNWTEQWNSIFATA